MMLSLQEAAELARVNKTTLFRAIKKGKVSASKDEHGQYRLDPAELNRVYPVAASGDRQQRATRIDELIAQLHERLNDMRDERDRARTDADSWRNAFETERAQRLALTAPESARLSWWRWLRMAG